jgi:hypothetical protein
MFGIELVERKVGEITLKTIPLDNLCPNDLRWIKSLNGNMTEEIYNQASNVNRVRKCDAHLVTIDTVQIVLIKECVLLWTILLGSKKNMPQMDQICQWLNETDHTHKGELMFIERETHEPIDHVGPEILYGDSLNEALVDVPSFIESTVEVEKISDSSMSDDDLLDWFDRDCVDLPAPPGELLLTDVIEVKPTEEEEVALALDIFFEDNTPIGEKELTLTEEEV